MQVQNTGLARTRVQSSGHAGQVLATARKKARKAERAAADEAEAATRGITVAALHAERARKVDGLRAKIPTIRGHVGPPPPEQAKADSELARSGNGRKRPN